MATIVQRDQPSETASLILLIEGDWGAEDLSSLMKTMEDLYNLLVLLNSKKLRGQRVREQFFPLERRTIRRLVVKVTAEPLLGVSRLHYASPGWIDLLGAGQAIRQLKEFILGITDRVLARKSRAVEVERKELELKSLKDQYEFKRKENRLRLTERRNQIDKKRMAAELDIVKKSEQIRALELANLSKELAFTTSVQKAFKDNRLSAGEQEAVVKWISSRARPLLDLVDSEKLKGLGSSDNSQENGEVP